MVRQQNHRHNESGLIFLPQRWTEALSRIQCVCSNQQPSCNQSKINMFSQPFTLTQAREVYFSETNLEGATDLRLLQAASVFWSGTSLKEPHELIIVMLVQGISRN